MSEIFDVNASTERLQNQLIDYSRNGSDSSELSLINMIQDMSKTPNLFNSTMRELNAKVEKDNCDNLLSVEFGFNVRAQNGQYEPFQYLLDFTVGEDGLYNKPQCDK